MINTTKMQIQFILKKKRCYIVFLILLTFVLVNYVKNIISFHGYDIVDMYHPMKIRLLVATDNIWGFYLLLLYPFLVVIPASFSIVSDRETNSSVYLYNRSGLKNYYFSKAISSAVVTFVIFSLPFFIEIILNMVAFPLHASGDPSNLGIYDSQYIEMVNRYYLSNIYLKLPYFYAVINVLLFGSVSAILSLAVLAISTLIKSEYKILLFLPVYLLFYILNYLKPYLSLNYSTSYFDYLMFYDTAPKNFSAFFSLLLLIVAFSSILLLIATRRDAFK